MMISTIIGASSIAIISVIVAASAIGSFFTAPFKEMLSTSYIAVILTAVSVYALYSIWRPIKFVNNVNEVPKEKTVLSLSIGFVLGALTTFTGLGGGVLMLPIFLAFFRFSQPQAVATSLFAVGLSSLASLVVQINQGTIFKMDFHLFLLMGGILVSVFILNRTLKLLSSKAIVRTRQIVFTSVVILALSKIF
jgi:uncharacterized membrane protein YfcA